MVARSLRYIASGSSSPPRNAHLGVSMQLARDLVKGGRLDHLLASEPLLLQLGEEPVEGPSNVQSPGKERSCLTAAIRISVACFFVIVILVVLINYPMLTVMGTPLLFLEYHLLS